MAGDSYWASVLPSEPLLAYLKKNRDFEGEKAGLKSLKPGDSQNASVSFDRVREVAESLRENGSDIHLHELLRGSEILFHDAPTPPRNPELEARIQQLKRTFEDEEYRRMTRTVDATSKTLGMTEFGSDVRLLRSHMAAALNFVVTVGACFLFGYKGTEYLLPVPKLAAQLLVGIVTGTIGALADLYFLIKHLETSER